MPLKNTTSAQSRSESFRRCTFESTRRFCQCLGSKAEMVSSPRGGNAGTLALEGQRVLEAPKRVGKFRVDQQYLHDKCPFQVRAIKLLRLRVPPALRQRIPIAGLRFHLEALFLLFAPGSCISSQSRKVTLVGKKILGTPILLAENPTWQVPRFAAKDSTIRDTTPTKKLYKSAHAPIFSRPHGRIPLPWECAIACGVCFGFSFFSPYW